MSLLGRLTYAQSICYAAARNPSEETFVYTSLSAGLTDVLNAAISVRSD